MVKATAQRLFVLHVFGLLLQFLASLASMGTSRS